MPLACLIGALSSCAPPVGGAPDIFAGMILWANQVTTAPRFLITGDAATPFRLHAHRLDPRSGFPISETTVTVGNLISDIIVNGTATHAYVAVDGAHEITAVRVDEAGNLSIQQSLASGVLGPDMLLFHPTKDVLYSSSNGGGNLCASYTIASNGNIAAQSTQASAGSQPQVIAVHPSGNFLYSADGTGNSISRFPLSGTGALTAPASVGSGGTLPRGLVVHPNGRFLYAVNNSSHTLATFSVDTSTGALTGPSLISAGGTNPRNLAINSEGTRLYSANSVSNTVSVFQIDPSAGTPVPLGAVDANGSGTFKVKLDVTERFLYVANGSSNTVAVMRTDRGTLPVLIGLISGFSQPEGLTISTHAELVGNVYP